MSLKRTQISTINTCCYSTNKHCEYQETTEPSKQPIRSRCLDHVTGYQPIKDQYLLIRSVPGEYFTVCESAIQRKLYRSVQ